MKIDKITNFLNLDKAEFHLQFKSHPNYPSALAFSDTLNFLGVKNDAYNLENEYWEELPEEFITVYDNNFALIKKENNAYTVYSEDVKTISKEELYKNSTDFVLLFEKEEQIKTKNTVKYKNWVFAILGVLVLYTFFQQNWFEAVFNLLSIVGVYVSLELFNKKFGQTSTILNNICGGNATNSQTNCSKIIDSDRINIFGLKISDFSLVYFIGILLLGIFLPAAGLVLKIITSISVLVILYSIFIQIFVEKALCKVCLLIITILVLQIVLSQFYFPIFFKLNNVILSIFAFVLSFSALVFINDILLQKEELKKSNLKNLKFKRNYELFKRELLLREKINFRNNKGGFFLGNKEAKLHISLISNPYCGFCKDAHIILEKLLKKYPDDISAQIRLNYFAENTNEEYTELLKLLDSTYKNESEKKFSTILENWFVNRDLQKLKAKPIESIDSLDVFIEIANENRELQFTFTPLLLINGYQFPEKYDREDIFYFIDDLLEEENL